MKISKLEIHNFRGIKSMSLDFSEHPTTILIGINGAGKSSVLNAISLLMSWIIARLRSETSNGRPISDNDITLGEDEAVIEITAKCEDTPVSWSLAKTKVGRKKQSSSNLVGIKAIVDSIQSRLQNPKMHSIPVIVYYPVHRAVVDIPLRIRNKHKFDEQLVAYEEALTSAANFRVFFEWYRAQEDLENEVQSFSVDEYNRQMQQFSSQTQSYQQAFAQIEKDLQSALDEPHKKELFERIIPRLSREVEKHIEEIRMLKNIADRYNNKSLMSVRAAIYKFLDGFTDLRVYRKPLRMVVQKADQQLEISQLSDGEKCLLALVGDLARRLAIANPESDDPLSGQGIVLIDEVDLHLHPGWQRMMVRRLQDTFPNCQFILTTHSPQVLGETEDARVYNLKSVDGFVVAETVGKNTFGRDCNSIIEDVMDGTERSTEIKGQLHEYFSLIDNGCLEEAHNIRKELERRIGSDEPEFARADVLIRRKEILGR